MSPTRFLCASEQTLIQKILIYTICINEKMTYKNTIMLRQPEIESRANAWKAFMLPLHHWRVDLHTLYIIYNKYKHKHKHNHK